MNSFPIHRRSFLAAIAAAGLPKQDPHDQPTFSTSIKVVNVLATARDKQGRIVTDLVKEDFTLLEDGQPQTITYFSRQTGLPLVLGLLVDTSYSERRMLTIERAASGTFLTQVLRPATDQFFLVRFDRGVELLQNLTSSRESLESSLQKLTPSAGAQSGTAFYDAIYLAATQLFARQDGRKALILLTDGEDNGSQSSLEQAVAAAQRADALAYAVRITDDEIGSMVRNLNDRSQGRKILRHVAKETGGAYFEYGKKQTLEEIYATIQEELRNQYSLGYTSNKPSPEKPIDGTGYRKILLTVQRKGVTIQARDGYYPASDATLKG